MTGVEVRDVVDLDSALLYYDLKSETIKVHPQLADKSRLETYPTWSPDGDYLYFCSAPILWSDRNVLPPKNYEKVRYDLMRISYDIDTDSWGRLETVLSASETGKSILLPRISPDGRFLMFCMCDYGCFPIYQPSSDLYIMDLEADRQTGNFAYRRLEINSDRCESWHCWSSNGRWIVFSSKRRGGVFTRSYISYVDEDGEVYKPLLLPQKDPAFYDSFLKTFSLPEFVVEPVQTREKDLADAVYSPAQIEVTMPLTGATPKAGPSDSWQQDRE
jgi:Tol biopolymer transport system component